MKAAAKVAVKAAAVPKVGGAVPKAAVDKSGWDKDKDKFREHLSQFYIAHNSDHTAPEKLGEIVDWYFEKQDQVRPAAATLNL